MKASEAMLIVIDVLAALRIVVEVFGRLADTLAAAKAEGRDITDEEAIALKAARDRALAALSATVARGVG